MSDWLDGWERRPRSDSGPMLRGAGRALLFHTMEGSFESGVGTLDRNNNWPHLAYDPPTRRKIHAIPFSRAGKSLANKPGGVETNRWGYIQVELSGRAAETQDWPDEWLRNIAEDVVAPVQAAVGNRLHHPRFYGTDAGFTLATVNAPQRMSHADWLAFDGICGHQHAPENDHWDPGKLDVARIVAHVTGSPTAPEEDTMRIVSGIDGKFQGLNYLIDTVTLPDGTRDAGIVKVSPDRGVAPYFIAPSMLALVAAGVPYKALKQADAGGLRTMPPAAIHGAVVDVEALAAALEPVVARVVDAQSSWFRRLFPKKAERAGTP